MENIANYQILSTLYKTEKTSIFLALNEQDEKVILKTTTSQYPTPNELKRLETEFEISQNIKGEGTTQTIALIPQGSSLVIIEQYIDAPTLTKFLQEKKLNLQESLQIAINIITTLERIHQKNVIHKDLNSNNILIKPDSLQTFIIDFDISTQLSVEKREISNVNNLEGSLLYISPEQTGRMNRNIDYRTDLYSLGVVLYELFVGELPFKLEEAMELVHAHIALMPQAPHVANPQIPAVISKIILKLLAKNAEDRYQSAKGLKQDLQQCLNTLQNNQIADFDLGTKDYSDKFNITQKLYGREQDRHTLLATFDEVCEQGTAKLVLVKGYSGIGKSALIQEVQKPITQQKGYYIKGKFEQFQQNIPYSALIQAFNTLIDIILTEPPSSIEQWKTNLLAGLEGNGQVVVEVIPRLELIIGKQPAAEKLPATEAQNRFNYTFSKFIKVFTQKSTPIVLVVDDLQWADSATLQLLELFLKEAKDQYLFIIASYRDNEVDEVHPLTLMLKDLAQHTTFESIQLQNLQLNHVQAIVADTLKSSIERVATLAQLLFEKTQGNPFFVNQFLITLYEEKLLTFDYNTYTWQWNDAQIKAQNITDNVVELLINKITKLPTETNQLLQIAAAYSNTFEVDILQKLSNTDTADSIEDALQYALSEQLILKAGNSYKFQHDRIQQAAYACIPEQEVAQLHLKIGLTLWQSTSEETIEQVLFDVVNQLNKAKTAITSAELLYDLRNLNFKTALKAKNANAYVSALSYLYQAMENIPTNIWETEYNFALEFYRELIEVEYFNGNFEKSKQYAEIALENAQTAIEKADIYNISIVQATLQAQYAEAIHLGKQALTLLGFTIPPDDQLESGIGAGIGSLMQNLAGRDILSLVDAPDAVDKRDILLAQILVNLAPPAYLSNPNLWTFIIIHATALGLKKGNVPELATAYSSYGILSGIIFGDYVSGYQYGMFAYKLCEKYNDTRQKCSTCFVLGTFLVFANQPAVKVVSTLKESVYYGLQVGDLQFTANSASNLPFGHFLQGSNIQVITAQVEESLQITYKYQNVFATDAALVGYVLAEALANENIKAPFDLPTTFDAILERISKNQTFTAICTLYYFKAITNLVMNKYEEASSSITECYKTLAFLVGTMHSQVFNFYYPLIQLQLVKNGLADKAEILEQTKDFIAKLSTLNDLNPANFYNKYALIQAELAQIEGKLAEAMQWYDTAIEESKKQGFILEGAIAAENAALFYEKMQRHKIAPIYWQEAQQAYQIWGATQKVEQLKKKYPFLLKTATNYQTTGTTKATISTQTTISSEKTTSLGQQLDFVTLLRASQTLSQEVVLETLLEKMMRTLIENSGAQRGFLFLNKNAKFYLEAEVDVSSQKINILQSIALSDMLAQGFELATEVVNYVIRTEQKVVLAEAYQQGQFTHIPYIQNQKVLSLLSLPLLKTGKIVGVLYLENNLSKGAFTSERLEVLNILSAQMAISVENALLYENLEDKVRERTLQLNEAYEEIKEQNEDIKQSINYGQRIQAAILPSIQRIKESLPNSFVLFKPRDVVSGDFYWFTHKNDKIVIAAVDCTGHGVPGAFMSMIGYALLSEIVSANNIFSPAEILTLMDKGIQEMLQQTETQNRDGMDFALCVWDTQQKVLHFAGAKNPLVYIQNNELFIQRGNKYSIGGEIRKTPALFEEVSIKIDSPTYCYIYSDGYQDQFGGAENKKFMKSELKNLLLNIYTKDMETQGQILEKTLLNWKGDYKQTDDILVIGFEVG